MRALIVAAAALINVNTLAQNNTAANIIEGGKTLVELVRVFKTPRYLMPLPQPVVERKDSCSIKNVSDYTIKNSTAKPLLVRSIPAKARNTIKKGTALYNNCFLDREII